MKLSANNTDEMMDAQEGPKLRNIHEEAEAPAKKPAGADKRLKICAAIVLVLVLFVGVRGFTAQSSLSSQVSKNQKTLDKLQAKADEYGITKDENGELTIPDVSLEGASEFEPGSVGERNIGLINDFTKLLLNWKGQSGYNDVRQKLMDEWSIKQKSKLLTSFMPELDTEINANMSMSGGPTVFLLSEDEKGTTYFLICTVRNTIDKTTAQGMVGIRLTIKKDGKLSNILAQTII